MQKNKLFLLVILFYIFLIPYLVHAKKTTYKQAKVVAENWIEFVLERDGNWGGSENPYISGFSEFTKDDMLLGYLASVKPKGYIIVSVLKNFAPIKAYSTESNLNPDIEQGMCALLKDVLVSRNKLLIERFGGMEQEHLKNINNKIPSSYRKAWQYLTEGKPSNLMSVNIQTTGPVGPLVESRWSQGPPFNDKCPDMECPGEFNQNAKVGCVPLAMAQIMRYYCWPPYHNWGYDWPNMLVNEANYDAASNWFHDESDDPWTQVQINAVADLCSDIGSKLDIDYGCSSTGAYVSSWYYDDVRDAFEDYFFYDTPGNEPESYERDTWDNPAIWFDIIKYEIDLNRPMVYSIQNSDNDFYHAIVVDGYDDSGGMYKVHANYGWGDNWHNTWYDLDWFDCNNDINYTTPCEFNEEELIRFIYPRNGLREWYTGTLGPWGGPQSLHHYVYDDTYSNDLTVQGGARVQFLPGVSLICNGNSININGDSPNETRFYSNGMPTKGLKVNKNGEIKLHQNGAITIY
jgi:hypothetical protein